MTNGTQNIPREPLGKLEAQFLTKVAVRPAFSIEEARQLLRHGKEGPTRQFLERLQRKGWIRRIKPGKFAPIPLSSGETRAKTEIFLTLSESSFASMFSSSSPVIAPSDSIPSSF